MNGFKDISFNQVIASNILKDIIIKVIACCNLMLQDCIRENKKLNNDEVAIRIADKTIRELSGAVIAAASRIFKPEQSFPVVLHGGVMRNPAITTGITRFVKERYPNAEIKHPVHSPGLGLALFTLHDMRRQQQSK